MVAVTLLWVTGSVALVITRWFPLSALGVALVLAQVVAAVSRSLPTRSF